MKQCRFAFDDGPRFAGFAFGATWNGFDSVAVTPDTHADVIRWLVSEETDDTTIADLLSLRPNDETGLISYGGGWATHSINEETPAMPNKPPMGADEARLRK